MFVEQEKLWINTGLNRKLSQQPGAEAMDGSDYRTIKRALVIQPKPSFICRCGLQDEIELISETLAHLVGGAIGKGDGNNLIDIEVRILAQDVEVTFDEHRRLARARSSRHRDVLVDLVSGGCLFRQQFALLCS